MSCSGAPFHRTASDARLDKWLEKMRGDAAEAVRAEGVEEVFPSLMVADEEVDLIDSVGGSVKNEQDVCTSSPEETRAPAATTSDHSSTRSVVVTSSPVAVRTDRFGFYHLSMQRADTSLRQRLGSVSTGP